MNLEELYKAVGGDFCDAVNRFGSENAVRRFVLKLCDDDNFSLLSESLDKNDCETAFRAAHTLKGICLNLGFTDMYRTVCVITEKLREQDIDGAVCVFCDVKREYSRLIELIKKTE